MENDFEQTTLKEVRGKICDLGFTNQDAKDILKLLISLGWAPSSQKEEEKFPICPHCTTEDLTVRHIAPVTNCPNVPKPQEHGNPTLAAYAAPRWTLGSNGAQVDSISRVESGEPHGRKAREGGEVRTYLEKAQGAIDRVAAWPEWKKRLWGEIPGSQVKGGIAAILAWQNNPNVHQLTCGNDSKHSPLLPVVDLDGKVGLVCVACAYLQRHIPEIVFQDYRE